MAKCLYFRQSMSSGSGGDEEPPANAKNNDPSSAHASSVPSTSSEADLVTQEDLDRLGLSSNGEFVDSSMEHQPDRAKQAHWGTDPPRGIMPHQLSEKKHSPNNGVAASSGSTLSGVSSLPMNIKSDPFLELPGGDWNPYDETPSLAEAILNTEFLKSIGIRDDPDGQSGSKMDTSTTTTNTNTSNSCIPFSASSVMDSLSSLSSDNTLMEGSSPEYKEETSKTIPIAKYNTHNDEAFQSDVSSNCSSLSDTSCWSVSNNRRSSPQQTHLIQPKPIAAKAGVHQQSKSKPLGTFWSLTNGTGLDPIPEDSITEAPAIYLPLVPPPLPKPATTSYNISFPTTLQPRPDRFDFWRNSTSIGSGRFSGGCHFSTTTASNGQNSAFSSPGAASPTIPQSPISHSPFHGAPNTSSLDSLDLQPMNIIEDNVSSLCKGANSKHKMASRKGRRDSQGANSAENKRRDSIKCGLDDLQRMLPHIGTPEEEKISQASVLYEAGKYIHQVKGDDAKISIEIEAVKKEIDDLNNQIEYVLYAYRKLAKLCAKTSIVEEPAKLPEEAMGFVSRGERGYSAKNCFRRKESAPIREEPPIPCASSGAKSVVSSFNRPERPD
ncbi:hypothetical protein TCAL_03204 [Tigriopus californicus]|uniref:BHLH domain-containing protein n=1 Tax=Tigriopus californicus TaxID=6832 RepID=A0A553N847_TIGCA|nr:hypothetical protein TCAL_03204 [Tigriopus californicus]